MKRLSAPFAVLFVVAACGGSTAPPTPAPAQPTPSTPQASAPQASDSGSSPVAGPVEITYLTGIAEDPELEVQAEAMVQEFNDTHPNIQVKRESLDNDQLRTIIQTRLGSGDVDVFGYDTGPGFGGVLAKAGLVADMAPAYEKYDWKTFDWAKSRCTYSGVLSCLPGQVEELGIYYNKDLLEAQGIAVPETLEQFTAAMDKLKAAKITPLAFGDQPQWPAGHQFSMTLSNLVGREGMDARLYGDKKWNDAESVRAIDIFFKQFLDAGYFPKDPNAVTYEDANALYYAGKAAMIPTGTWLVSEITGKTKDKFETGFFPFPAIDGKPASPPAGLGGGTFVASNSKNKDAAFEFLDWTISDAVVKKWLLPVFNQIPAQPVDTTGVEVSPLFQIVVDDLAASSGTSSEFGYNIDVLTPAGFNAQMFTGFQEVLNGTLTPQAQADKLQAEYEKAMANGETIPKP